MTEWSMPILLVFSRSSARHSNIVQLVIDNKTGSLLRLLNSHKDSSGARKSKRRLFDVFAETKSTKDVHIRFSLNSLCSTHVKK